MDTGSFIAYIKTDDIYKDIVEDVQTRFNTSNHELDRPLPKGKNKNVIGLMKYELGGRVMTTFVGLRAKTYSYLIDDGSEYKKAKGTKMCVIKNFKFKNYKNCLGATKLDNKISYPEEIKLSIDSFKRNHKQFIRNNKSILKTQQIFKSKEHNVFTEEFNWIALSSNDDQRMQSIDLIETYAYGTSKYLVSEKEEIKCNNIIKRYRK